MTIRGVSSEQRFEYLSNGGTLVFTIDSTEIDEQFAFESSAALKDILKYGFEIRPSPVIFNSPDFAKLLLHADSWDRVILVTYQKGGTIVYRKLEDGMYEATANIPKKP